MELIVIVIALAILIVILAFILGFMVSRGEESVSEHAAWLRGFKAGVESEKKKREENK